MKNIITISAPSGTGKTTLCKAVQEKLNDIKWSISVTTRNKRRNEVNGVDYDFVTKDVFNDLLKNKKFAEWEMVHGNYYGTLNKSIENAIDLKETLLLELDVKGAMCLKKLYPKNSFSIFIIPPSLNHLRERLRKRGTDSIENIEIRLQRFEQEMNSKDYFDEIMINEDLESAKLELINIIKKIKEGVKSGIKNNTIS